MTLKNLDFEGTALYSCEVSLESPIFTKASNEEHVIVIRECCLLILLSASAASSSNSLLTSPQAHAQVFYPHFFFVPVPQNNPPTIIFKKRQFYVGEKLVANCTSSRSKPVPHIVWLINGKKVNIWKQIFLEVFLFVACLRAFCRALKFIRNFDF